MSQSSPIGKFPCPNCELFFTLKANRKRHIARKHSRTQKQEERYQCAVCHKKYSTKCYLKDHIRIVHRNDKTISAECKICFKKFSSRNAVRDHKRYMHNVTYVAPVTMFTCDHCNRQFNKKHNMQVHIMYSPCNPLRIIRKRIECPHCGFECLESGLKGHIRLCAARKVIGSPVNPQRRKHPNKQKVYSVTENPEREIKTRNFENDTVLAENIDCFNVCCVKVEDIDENSMEDGSSANFNATLRRSNRKRKRVDYQVLNGDSFAITNDELMEFCKPLDIQKSFKINENTIKLETTENELSTLDMNETDFDITSWDSIKQTQHNCLLSNPEDISNVFRSNILINSKISYAVCEDFSKYTEVSPYGLSSNNTEEKNIISSTNVLDNETFVMKHNTEDVNVMNYVLSSKDVETSEIQAKEIKKEQIDHRTETYEGSDQNKVFISSAPKQEIDTDIATEITKEEEELIKLVHKDLATSQISQQEYEDDAKSETMKDIRFYKYLGII